ncbi:S41 family peptidase [Teichococcus oryzae]|uniref:S41 family peptidase n=1 Tax=Teichococcus oryzae TaxID=1608942 RepID=UPI001375B4EB|nr:S41 family peptidase [Pseudoroseomonas oryzae]
MAFANILERQIEPASPADLALWSLRGLAALDTAFAIQAVNGRLHLSHRDELLAARPLAELTQASLLQRGSGAAADLVAAIVTEYYGAAWAASAAVRSAGSERLLQAGFDEVFNHLDPYSRYVTATEAQQLRQRRIGQSALGFRIATGSRNAVLVVAVSPEGPAQRAGMREGDIVLAINGQAVAATRIAEAAELLEGPPGTTLQLTLRRGGRRILLTLVRDGRSGSALQAELRDGLLWLRLGMFSSHTATEVAEALDEALTASPRLAGVILDLRGNRGGLLQQAMSVADAFLSGGTIAQSQGRHPAAQRIWQAVGGDLAQGRPVVALVDGRTASAAEIVAAALSDRGRAVVVGSSTLGKGLIQVVVPLPNDAEILISWARLLAPHGWPVQGLGVLPALCTSLGQEAMQRDLQSITQGVFPRGPLLGRMRSLRAPVPASEVSALRGTCPPAEGRTLDQVAARFILEHPAAYQNMLAR